MPDLCPNCRTPISRYATDCPGCGGPLRQPPRDIAAPVFAWMFVMFNLLMAGWLCFYMFTGRFALRAPSIANAATEGGDAAVAPLGGNLGVGYLVTLWLWGLIVLGLCAMVSLVRKPKGRSRQNRF